MLDAESLASMALFDLADAFQVNPSSPAHPLSISPIPKFPVVESQVRGGELDAKVAAALNLEGIIGPKVGEGLDTPGSKGIDAVELSPPCREAACAEAGVAQVTPETLPATVSGGVPLRQLGVARGPPSLLISPYPLGMGLTPSLERMGAIVRQKLLARSKMLYLSPSLLFQLSAMRVSLRRG